MEAKIRRVGLLYSAHARPRSARLAAAFATLFLFAGCPGGGAGNASQSPSPPRQPTLNTPQAIIEADGTNAGIQAALADIALATTQSTNLRYLAMRKLEDAHAPNSLSVSETLARSTLTTSEASFLRNNAFAALRRAQGTPDGQAALDRAKASSPQAAATAQALARSGS